MSDAPGAPTWPIVRHADAAPDFLAIGHVTRDLLPDGSWRLGGTVAFAALTAARLGLRPAIVTSASASRERSVTRARLRAPQSARSGLSVRSQSTSEEN